MAKYEKYAEYKDSGVEWLGEIPSHWTSVAIKFLAKEKNSLFLDGDWIESKDISENGVRYITTGNVGEGFYKEQGMGYITETTFKKLSCTEVFPNDILISRLNVPIGRACLVPDLESRVVTSVDNVIFRPDSEYYKNFLVYLFTSKDYFRHTENVARGATMQRISRGLLGNIRVVIPSKEEQIQIANFLDYETAKIDSLIEKQQLLIQLLKEKRQAVISHAVTKGLNPNVPMKDSGVEWLGEVPEHWELPKLFYITNRIGDGLHSTPIYQDGTGYYFINGNNLVDGKISIGETAKEVPESEYIKHQVTLNKATVLLSINGTIGKVALFDNEPVILGKSAAYINCQSNLSPGFLANFLTTSEAKKYYDLEVTGTTIFNLSLNSIRNMKIPLPPLDEQIQITAFVSKQFIKYENLINAAEKQNNLLQERRTALISAAVTGKIDVRNWQKPTEAKMEFSA